MHRLTAGICQIIVIVFYHKQRRFQGMGHATRILSVSRRGDRRIPVGANAARGSQIQVSVLFDKEPCSQAACDAETDSVIAATCKRRDLGHEADHQIVGWMQKHNLYQ